MGKTYVYYHDIIIRAIVGGHCRIYLRSVNQKRLFAMTRARYVRNALKKYSETVTDKYGTTMRGTTSFPVEIQLDHFIVSSRSCIEHLLQLINCYAKLGLAPTSHIRSDKVDIDNVISRLLSSNDVILNKLGEYINKEKKEGWYRTLHELRIEMFHNKFERFNNFGEQIKIRLPNGQEVDIPIYCNVVVGNLHRVLAYSMRSLVKFKKLAFK